MYMQNATRFLKSLEEKGLSPVEEAVYRKLLDAEHDAALIPKTKDEEQKALYFAHLKVGERCPQDVTGICSDSVVEPSVVVDTIGNEQVPYHQRITVQWFGRNQSVEFTPLQFRFELVTKIDDIHWMRVPEKFRVAFIGQIKDWPNAEAVPGILNAMQGCTAESYAAWVWTDYYTTASMHGEVPASFLCQVICLGNPSVGAIFPKTHTNTKPLDEITSALIKKQRQQERDPFTREDASWDRDFYLEA